MNRLILTIFSLLLRLYPRAFRERFAVEMHGVFADSWTDAARYGLWAAFRFIMREYVGVVAGMIRAHHASSGRGWLAWVLTSPRLFIPLLLAVCASVAAPLSLGRWGYLITPPSPQPVIGPLASVDSVRFVQFDPDYRASVVPTRRLPERVIDEFPPTRLLPLLRDRLGGAALAEPLESAFARQLGEALRRNNVQLGSRGGPYFDEPRPVSNDCRGCYYLGLRMLPDGNLLQIYPLLDARGEFSGETSEHIATPDDRWYYGYLMPAAYVIRGTADDGTPLVVVSLASGMVTGGDRYQYYEFLFEPTDTGWTTRAETRYNFDIAGMEGFTFPVLTFVFAVAVLLLWLAALIVWQIARRIANMRPPRQIA